MRQIRQHEQTQLIFLYLGEQMNMGDNAIVTGWEQMKMDENAPPITIEVEVTLSLSVDSINLSNFTLAPSLKSVTNQIQLKYFNVYETLNLSVLFNKTFIINYMTKLGILQLYYI